MRFFLPKNTLTSLTSLIDLVAPDLLLDLLDPPLESENLLLEGGFLAFQRRNLLLKPGVIGALLTEVPLDFVLHALDIRNHSLLELLELRLIMLFDVLLIVSWWGFKLSQRVPGWGKGKTGERRRE